MTDRSTESGARSALVERATAETDVSVRLVLDGTGSGRIDTGVGFFDHMLDLFTRHGLFDVEIAAKGDLETGAHHTVEDVGICLGTALAQAAADKTGLTRYGSALVPMDEALALAAVDFGGRAFLAYDVEISPSTIGGLDTNLVPEFFQAVVSNARITLHLRVLAGGNPHHVVEALFKAFARALDQATRLDGRVQGVPSTKGLI